MKNNDKKRKNLKNQIKKTFYLLRQKLMNLASQTIDTTG